MIGDRQRIMRPAGRIPRLQDSSHWRACRAVRSRTSSWIGMWVPAGRLIMVKQLLLGRLPTASVNHLDGRSWHLYASWVDVRWRR